MDEWNHSIDAQRSVATAIGALVRQNEKRARNGSFCEPQQRNLHEFWYCHNAGMPCRKTRRSGRDRQRWCRESSLNLATHVWLSFVSGNRGPGSTNSTPYSRGNSASEMGGFEHDRDIWKLRIRQSILDPVNLGRGQNLSSGKRTSILCNERQLAAPRALQLATERVGDIFNYNISHRNVPAGLNECS